MKFDFDKIKQRNNLLKQRIILIKSRIIFLKRRKKITLKRKQKGKPLFATEEINETPLWNLNLNFQDSVFVKPNGDTIVEKIHYFTVSL